MGSALGGSETGNEGRSERSVIKSYQDLEVYQNSYTGMLEIFRKILPKLPKEEKYDLVDQLRRSCKAKVRLAEEKGETKGEMRRA